MKVRFYEDVTEDDVRQAFGDTVLDSDTVIECGKYKVTDKKDIFTNILCIILCIPMLLMFSIFALRGYKDGDSSAVIFCIYIATFILGIILSIAKLAKNFSSVYYICTNRVIGTKNAAARKPKMYNTEDILCFIYKVGAGSQEIWLYKKNHPKVMFFACCTQNARHLCAEYADWCGIEYIDYEILFYKMGR